MAIKLKSVLKIQKQPLLLAVRALLFTAALWLLADQHFSAFQLTAFLLIGGALYFVPVFQTLLVLPSFLSLMVISPIAMSVFGSQIRYPFLLAAVFGIFFFIILGIKQVVFIKRLALHRILHLGLLYCLSILFFAAQSSDWYILRSLLFFVIAYYMLREFFILQGTARGPHLRLHAFLLVFMLVEALWILMLLPLGFINAASILLVLCFALEEIFIVSQKGGVMRKTLAGQLVVCSALFAVILLASSWTIP